MSELKKYLLITTIYPEEGSDRTIDHIISNALELEEVKAIIGMYNLGDTYHSFKCFEIWKELKIEERYLLDGVIIAPVKRDVKE